MLDRRKAKCIQRGLFRCSIRKLRVKKKKEERKEKRKKLANCQIVLAKQIRTTNNESRLVRFDRLCIL